MTTNNYNDAVMTEQEMADFFMKEFDTATNIKDYEAEEDDGGMFDDKFGLEDVLLAEEEETLELEEGYDEDEDYDEESEGSEDDASDEDLDSIEQFTETFTQKWDLIQDSHVFDFGNVQLTKADLQDAAVNRENHIRLNNAFTEYEKEFEDMNRETDLAFDTARTETEAHMELIKRKLSRGEFSGEAKVRAYEDVERLSARMDKLNQERDKITKIHAERERKMAELRVHNVDQEMNKRYGAAWGKQIAPRVVQYAKSNGFSEEMLVKNSTPELMEILYKAVKYDTLKTDTNKKAEKAFSRGAKSTVKAKAAKTRLSTQGARMSKAKAYERAVSKGDTSMMYDLLED